MIVTVLRLTRWEFFKLRRRWMPWAVGVAANFMQDLMSLGVGLHDPPNLHPRALELASRLKQGAVYDVYYLALAESLGCELWTADQGLYRVASSGVGNVRWIGDFSASL